MSDKTFGQLLGGHTAGRDQGYPEDLPRFREGFGFMTADIFPELVSCCVPCYLLVGGHFRAVCSTRSIRISSPAMS